MPLKGHASEWRGAFLVALSGTLFGFIGYLGTQLFHLHFSVENMLFWRFLIATSCVALLCFFAKQPIWPSQKKPSFLIKIALFATLSFSGASAFYFLASQYIGTGVAMVIFYSFPVFVTLFAWLLEGWRFTIPTFISLLAVIIGLIFLKGKETVGLNIVGLGLGIIAALSYAIYVYSNKHIAKQLDVRVLTLLVCFGNTLLFLLVACYTHTLHFPNDWHAWIYLAAIAIFATVLPIQLLLSGLKYISPIKASLLSVLEPVVSVCLGFMLLHESMSLTQLLGIFIVITGALYIQFDTPKQEEK